MQEGLINLVTFGALVEMMDYFREKLVHIFSRKLKIHEARQNVEEFRAGHLLILEGEDASEQPFEFFPRHNLSTTLFSLNFHDAS
ncbi:MAG: hypothetical protein ACREQV_18330 [Candidatus Binatia bacterium]